MDKKQSLIVWIAGFFICTVAAPCFAREPQMYSNPANAIEVAVGTDFSITLESNRTTGYEWQIAESLHKDMLQLAGSEYIRDKTSLVGAGGKEVWTFKALKAGEAAISFKYVRPWERDIFPVKQEVFVIIVKERPK